VHQRASTTICFMRLILLRKKLEPQDEKTPNSRVDPDDKTREMEEPEVDALSVLQQEAPPWVESYEITSTDMDG